MCFFLNSHRWPLPPHLPYQRWAHMGECGFWEDAKVLSQCNALMAFYLPSSVPNLQPGFGAEYILLPASRAGISTTTLWPLWHRWHSKQREVQRMCEAEIRKLGDTITLLLSLNRNSNWQTLAVCSNHRDGDLIRSSAGVQLLLTRPERKKIVPCTNLLFTVSCLCFCFRQRKGRQDGCQCLSLQTNTSVIL